MGWTYTEGTDQQCEDSPKLKQQMEGMARGAFAHFQLLEKETSKPLQIRHLSPYNKIFHTSYLELPLKIIWKLLLFSVR